MQKVERYKITLETLEPLRIGGPDDPLQGQVKLVTMIGDEIVIPGASLKGALRSEIERYLIDSFYDLQPKEWQKDKGPWAPCIPAPKLSFDERKLVNSKKYSGEACQYNPNRKLKEDEKKCICPACYLLGANGLPGFVRVPFLRPVDPILAGELYSSSIDRFTETVKQGTNRPYSIVPNGTVFDGVLEVLITDTIRDWHFGTPRGLGNVTHGDLWLRGSQTTKESLIQDFLIDRLQSIQMMGGHKSKGCGKISIKIEKIKKS